MKYQKSRLVVYHGKAARHTQVGNVASFFLLKKDADMKIEQTEYLEVGNIFNFKTDYIVSA
jgi:hypothetical protein